MNVALLLRQRIPLCADLFPELLLWQLLAALPDSEHQFKYRHSLPFVRSDVCLVRFDNEAGKV